jgi:uncharacterized membrane protein YbhN (UPF0104 family)
MAAVSGRWHGSGMSLSTALRLPAGGLRSLAADLTPGETPPGSWPARGRWAPIVLLAGAAALAALIVSHDSEFLRAIDRALHASWQLVAVAVLLEAASIAGYVVLLHRVVSRASRQLRLGDSYDITLGGAAATRLLPTAGLGGAAVTVWVLRARGVRTSELVERLLAFLFLLYGVYMSALFAAGAAIAAGLVSVPSGAGLGAVAVAISLAVGLTLLIAAVAPSRLAPLLDRAARRSPRAASAARVIRERLPVVGAASRRAWVELRRPHPALLGAVAWWAFDIGVLATMLHAFGVGLPIAAVVLAYFLGTLLNLVPLPGSLSGGLAGALIALGAPISGAIAAVLAYRTLAVWLPAAPGVASLLRLRRSVAAWRATDVVLTAPAHAGSPYRPRVPRRPQCLREVGQLQGETNVIA